MLVHGYLHRSISEADKSVIKYVLPNLEYEWCLCD